MAAGSINTPKECSIPSSLINRVVKYLSLMAMMGLVYSPAYANLVHLKSYSAQYALYWHGIKAGNSYQKLSKMNDGSDLYRIDASAVPSVTFLPYRYQETSYFKIESNGPRFTSIPVQFIYKGEEGSKHKSGRIHFDWDKLDVLNTEKNSKNKEKRFEHAIKRGYQDKLTVNFMLRQDITDKNAELKYQVVEDAHIKEYHFKRLGKEILQTPLGSLDTLVVSHTNPLNQRTTKLWLSPKHEHLIVKMEQYRKDKLFIKGTIQKLHID